ncbi:MAG: ribonuclease P protein component [Planctomycetaceae bacterium]|jgi:ribonuclease P protein component|nr:ribonuclease P protein component [Planctomycetaceae bacterium]MBT4013437.1 ribonuclease P protein component [Planctomycetaceae bacterium]MBT4723731.1 ribonuclease P protein component [Planctomycetaceae bacterium]MBT4846178.1 ribonuclease P protein component [Planctomycetaceae bacterium]MBT5599382.1 ribonuclease P protein component [Planctomycetaceae bacterium]
MENIDRRENDDNINRNLSFPKSRRLLVPAEFKRVYHRGVHCNNRTLVLNVCTNDLGHNRLGLSISKQVGNAVVRNRWKRRIREAFRCRQQHHLGGFDIVVRSRKGAACDSHAIDTSLNQLIPQAIQQLSSHRNNS